MPGLCHAEGDLLARRFQLNPLATHVRHEVDLPEYHIFQQLLQVFLVLASM